jgi:hypothetical protein
MAGVAPTPQSLAIAACYGNESQTAFQLHQPLGILGFVPRLKWS